MPHVAQSERLRLTVTHDLHAAEVVDLPHVTFFELCRHESFDGSNSIQLLARHDEVVDVHEDQDAPVPEVASLVEARVYLGSHTTGLTVLLVELDTSQPPSLLCFVERHLMPTHLFYALQLDAVGDFDVHLFVHLGIEEGCLIVDMMNLSARGCSHSREGPRGSLAGHRFPRLVKVPLRHLVEALGHKAGLVRLHLSLCVVLDGKHKTRLDNLVLLVIHLNLRQGLKLLVCCHPFLIACFQRGQSERARASFSFAGGLCRSLPD